MQILALKPSIAIAVSIALCLGACTSSGSEDQLEEEVARLSEQLTEQSAEIDTLSRQVALQAGEISTLKSVSSSLKADIESVRDVAQANLGPTTDPQIEARLSAVEATVADQAAMLGWPGNFADGLWADMEAVLDCLNEILERGGVAVIPNNSCRLINAGTMGGY